MSRRQLRQFLCVSLLSLCLPVSVNAKPADKDEIEQVLAALGSGSSADLKGRLFAGPLTVLDGAFRAEALNALPAALREQRVTHGPVLRRVEWTFSEYLGCMSARSPLRSSFFSFETKVSRRVCGVVVYWCFQQTW